MKHIAQDHANSVIAEGMQVPEDRQREPSRFIYERCGCLTVPLGSPPERHLSRCPMRNPS